MKTEVESKRGRKWVYGPLDPARPLEIKFLKCPEFSPEWLAMMKSAMTAVMGGIILDNENRRSEPHPATRQQNHTTHAAGTVH